MGKVQNGIPVKTGKIPCLTIIYQLKISFITQPGKKTEKILFNNKMFYMKYIQEQFSTKIYGGK